MEISEKRMLPLNLDNCTDFKPKRERIKNTKNDLIIDVHVNEEDEQLLKLRDLPRRKSSTGSTSTSKPEDPSDLFSFPNSPSNLTANSNKEYSSKKLFFSKDKNCSNLLYNFYQSTEEYFQEKYAENKNYIKSKNYISKQDYIESIFNPKESKSEPKEDLEPKNIILNNNITDKPLNNTSKTPLPTLIAPFNPSLYNGMKGKFDMPMYYYCIGFYQYDPNLMKQKTEEKKEDINTNANPGLNNSNTILKNDKNPQQQQQPIIIGTPIFFNNMTKFGYNKTFKRKGKPFTEREGDWVCHSCKNLNFAFRVECNRCHLPKNVENKKDKIKGIKKVIK